MFGEDAELYDRARPSYPAELIDDVVALVGSAARALDIGCGTAKATTLLAARGLSGVGVEPHPEMAAIARRHLSAHPKWRVDTAAIEDWAPAPGYVPFDLVTCAQARHWLDPKVRITKAHASLRPGGWLALWWNRPDEDDSLVRRAIDAAYQAHVPELPSRGIGAQGRPRPDDDVGEIGFEAPIEHAYHWSATYTATEWANVLRTQSDHRLLDPARRERLLAAVVAAIANHGGIYHHPYVCWVWTAQRRIGNMTKPSAETG